MKTLTFNRVHKNGWLSYKLPGVAGAVYVDKRMLTPEALATPAQTIDVEIPGMLEPGAGVSEVQAAKNAKKLELEQKKAERLEAASAKAAARLQKLQDQAAKAQEKADAAKAKGPATPAEATA